MSDHIGLPNDERYQRALEEFRTSFLKGQELAKKAGTTLNVMVKMLSQQKRLVYASDINADCWRSTSKRIFIKKFISIP